MKLKAQVSFRWKRRGFNVSAEVAGNHLRHLEAKAGKNRLSPDIVLEDARNPKSPLHPCFDWDDTAAAESYRRVQAQYLLRSIEIVVVHDHKKVRTRVYEVILRNHDEEERYVNAETIASSPKLRKDFIEQGKREFVAVADKYERFDEFADVVQAIRKL